MIMGYGPGHGPRFETHPRYQPQAHPTRSGVAIDDCDFQEIPSYV